MIRSLRMQPNRKLYFKELPMPPTPGPGEVQVRMAFASICGYDMMMLRGTAAYPLNGYLGHEGSGVVTAVGENVRVLHPGDRVTINPYEPCGLCDACRSNRPEYCTNPSSGYANLMTEYLNIRQQQVFRLPEQVSLRAGSLIEPLMMAMHAVSKARLGYGKRVILLGCGAMGQNHPQACAAAPGRADRRGRTGRRKAGSSPALRCRYRDRPEYAERRDRGADADWRHRLRCGH